MVTWRVVEAGKNMVSISFDNFLKMRQMDRFSLNEDLEKWYEEVNTNPFLWLESKEGFCWAKFLFDWESVNRIPVSEWADIFLENDKWFECIGVFWLKDFNIDALKWFSAWKREIIATILWEEVLVYNKLDTPRVVINDTQEDIMEIFS